MILDVGSGPHPEKTADVIADLYEDGDTTSRGDGKLNILPHQKFVKADIQDMPFSDNEFEYVYAKHILEHVDDPEKACLELMRVANAGYIETPTSLWETLFGRKYHKWLVDKNNNALTFRIKTEINCPPNSFNGDKLFSSVPVFNQMFKDNIDLFSVRYHWKGHISYSVIT